MSLDRPQQNTLLDVFCLAARAAAPENRGRNFPSVATNHLFPPSSASFPGCVRVSHRRHCGLTQTRVESCTVEEEQSMKENPYATTRCRGEFPPRVAIQKLRFLALPLTRMFIFFISSPQIGTTLEFSPSCSQFKIFFDAHD